MRQELTAILEERGVVAKVKTFVSYVQWRRFKVSWLSSTVLVNGHRRYIYLARLRKRTEGVYILEKSRLVRLQHVFPFEMANLLHLKTTLLRSFQWYHPFELKEELFRCIRCGNRHYFARIHACWHLFGRCETMIYPSWQLVIRITFLPYVNSFAKKVRARLQRRIKGGFRWKSTKYAIHWRQVLTFLDCTRLSVGLDSSKKPPICRSRNSSFSA